MLAFLDLVAYIGNRDLLLFWVMPKFLYSDMCPNFIYVYIYIYAVAFMMMIIMKMLMTK